MGGIERRYPLRVIQRAFLGKQFRKRYLLGGQPCEDRYKVTDVERDKDHYFVRGYMHCVEVPMAHMTALLDHLRKTEEDYDTITYNIQ